jgi:hypothetical protein
MAVGIADRGLPLDDPRVPWALPVLLGGGAILGGLIAGTLTANGHGITVFAVALLAFPVVLWRKPALGPVVLVVMAAAIEQYQYMVGTHAGAFTSRVPLFSGLAGHLNPADVLLIGLTLIWLLKVAGGDAAAWPRTALSRAVLTLMGAVAIGLVIGKLHHGDTRTALLEVRPYVYMTLTFALTVGFIATRSAIRAILWGLVLVSAFKAALGIRIFISVRHMQPRPEAVLGHEEAFFFGLYVLLTLGLWVFDLPGRLRTTATALLPLVVVGDLVNSRRTAWLILAGGAVVMLVIGMVTQPNRRRVLGGSLVVVAFGAAIYLPVYWDRTGSLGQPARAVHSFVSPDPRDESSDLYRREENANLKYNIRASRPLGMGFGVKINYVYPIADLTATNALIAYIPHNGVLYIIMRMGVFGGIAFWSLIAIAIVNACRLAKHHDRELAFLGALIACALIAYLLQGYNDQGFFFYRIAFVVGAMLGLLEVGARLAAAPPKHPDHAEHAVNA